MIGAALVGFGLSVAGTPALAQPDRPLLRAHATPPTDVSAQARKRARRAPTRITVSPTRRLVRECSAWYALERRPSGDVITPQMRCWWVAQ
jgi:hypothetical protein